MGRYNNKRTQAAAAEMRNTPSRARFSKGPPRRNKKRGKPTTTTTENKNKNGRNQAVNARVIEKLQNRQQQLSSSTPKQRVATTEEALSFVDKSKFDKITLPKDMEADIDELLQMFGIKETEASKEDEKSMLLHEDDEIVDEDQDELSENTIEQSSNDDVLMEHHSIRRSDERNTEYNEYDDDVDEETYDETAPVLPGLITDETDWDGEVDTTPIQNDGQDEQDDDGDGEEEEGDLPEHVKNSPVFLHLTQRLSFSDKDASRACIAIEDWGAVVDGETSKPSERVGLAMDWLCLHLTEDELTKGFKPNETTQQTKQLLHPMTNIKLKAIPHPSISVAKSITSEEWKSRMRLENRVLQFVKMGFLHSEASLVCEKNENVEDDYLLLVELLELLEAKACATETNSILNPTCDLQDAAAEREDELLALEAIYDEDLETSKSGNRLSYTLKLSPIESLLKIYPKPGYPSFETCLLLFENETFAPSLCRRINDKIALLASQSIGLPVVFDIVNFLTESVHEMQTNFIKEQRYKEFEAEQLRLVKQRQTDHHGLNQPITAQYDGELGRRQRAKIKAAEKSYNRADQIEKQSAEFRQRQAERIQNVKEENKSIRFTMAEQTILQREKDRIQEEAERQGRKAMNDAFNRGESVESARIAAKRAKAESLKKNGIDECSPKDKDEAVDETPKTSQPEEKTDPNPTPTTAAFMERLNTRRHEHLVQATPTTTAFMDRLRQMYDKAAKEKSGQVLEEGDEDQKDSVEGYYLDKATFESGKSSLPSPVAIPSREMQSLIEDEMLKIKQEPWLVSRFARVPKEIVSKPQFDEEEGKDDEEKREQEMKISHALRIKHEDKHQTKAFLEMMKSRQALPAFQKKPEIIKTILSSQVTVIAGDTGCGKTTQIPQLVLDHLIETNNGAKANIIITQPRRISAIGVARRIAEERCEQVGQTCGYSIKLEKKTSPETRLLLVTVGILLRRLQADPDLAAVSHIFVDETHERDVNTDFLLIILRDLLNRRRDLKLILMSATMTTDLFASYFKCPIVEIPGRTHPVSSYRLEDILELTSHTIEEDSDYALKDETKTRMSKGSLRKLYPTYSKETIHTLSIVDESKLNFPLVASVIEFITLKKPPGAILVFMPGAMEIQKTIEELYKKEIFQSNGVLILPLHSSMSSTDQNVVFQAPPQGVRKIIIATNIAETSITINDVVYVVDSGKKKELRKEKEGSLTALVECFVSKANAKQRRGRAGRVRPGMCFHLFSSHTFNSLLDQAQPEIQRVGIHDLLLQILLLDLGDPISFLRKALDPPDDNSLKSSLQFLESLGGIEVRGDLKNLNVSTELTPLGFHLATLPCDPRVGKLLIYGSLFGCLDTALTIAASLSSNNPFISSFEKREEADLAHRRFMVHQSDHLSINNAFNQYVNFRGNRKAWLKENFLGRLTLVQMVKLRQQYQQYLKDIGIPSSNKNLENIGLTKAVLLCAGMNIVVAPKNACSPTGSTSVGEQAFAHAKFGEIYVHPSSLLHSEKSLSSRYCCYHNMVKTSKIYVRDLTVVSPLSLVFSAKLEVYQTQGICSIDGWLKFRIDRKAGALLKYLKKTMDEELLELILHPKGGLSEKAKMLIRLISRLFQRETEENASIPDRSGGEIVRPWTGTENIASRNQGRQGGRGRGRRNGGRGRSQRPGRGQS